MTKKNETIPTRYLRNNQRKIETRTKKLTETQGYSTRKGRKRQPTHSNTGKAKSKASTSKITHKRSNMRIYEKSDLF